MKKVALLSVLVLVIGLVALPAAAGEQKKGEHDMNVSFVSCDAKAKTMTFKTADGEQKTAPMVDTVAKSCSNMKAGEMVTITCTDNEKGEHQTISNMKTAMASKEHPKH